MRRPVPVVALVILVWSLMPASASATVDPPTATMNLSPGSSGSETKTVGVPDLPPAADIELAIDTTGSMGPSIQQAKADALAIVAGVQG